jgi:vitamin B12 transporter
LVCRLVAEANMVRSTLLFVASFFVLVSTSWAQAPSASLAGTVTDPLGASIARAAVSLVHDGAVAARTDSDARGAFAFEGLSEGRYHLQVTAEGFEAWTTKSLFLAAGGRRTLTVPLPIGRLETEVTVSATAGEVLPSSVGSSVTVLDAKMLEATGKPDVLEALRLVPGSSLVQSGARGGATSMFIRGGDASFNKVVVDGVPANDIGGGNDLSQLAMTGVDRVEVLRQANSVLSGTDALAGVISVTSSRGGTRVPLAALSFDGGSLSTNHAAASIGGVAQRVDYFSELSRFSTDNDGPNNSYRNTTYAGRFGAAVGRNTDLTGTVRWIDRYYQSPNGRSFYAVPDDFSQKNRVALVGVGGETRFTDRWQGALRFGASDQRLRYENPTLSGEDMFGVGFGSPVTIRGANGYSATGRAALDYGPYAGGTRSARQGIYARTTYELKPGLALSAGTHYEREQAFSDPDADPTTTRHTRALWVEGRGSIAERITVAAGLGQAHIEGYASRFAPRVSIGAYLRRAASDALWGDTRLTFNAGRGIKATSATAVDQSLFRLLNKTPTGSALAAGSGIGPIGPERGRNLDLGLEQDVWQGRARVRAAYFDNRFFDLIEFVSRNQLPQFGLSPSVAAAVGTGAYVNSQSFDAKGVETWAEARFWRIRLAGGYTYLDATVTKSLSSAVAPQFNPRIPGVAIGGYAPLVGQRPFRRPGHTGSLLVAYSQGPADVAVTGYFAGVSDDSTFLVGSDLDFGNSLLLPNRDLNAGYQKVDVTASWRARQRVKLFATVENLLDQHYEPVFGFPALPVNLRAGVTVGFGGR